MQAKHRARLVQTRGDLSILLSKDFASFVQNERVDFGREVSCFESCHRFEGYRPTREEQHSTEEAEQAPTSRVFSKEEPARDPAAEFEQEGSSAPGELEGNPSLRSSCRPPHRFVVASRSQPPAFSQTPDRLQRSTF